MEKYALTLDRGNSSSKLALRDQAGNIVLHLRAEGADGIDACIGLIRRAAERGPIGCAAFASVVKDGGDVPIMQALRELVVDGGLCIQLGADTPMPMDIDYSTPQTLGADRLAAALGALALIGPGHPLLVVDLGSAITYDLVDASGTYRGGNIAPGISARLRALHEVAPALPLVAPEGELPVFGHSTETAIRAGVIRGVAAEIAYYTTFLGPDVRVILTGGDAALYAGGSESGEYLTIEPDLIHLGLKRLLEYNETL